MDYWVAPATSSGSSFAQGNEEDEEPEEQAPVVVRRPDQETQEHLSIGPQSMPRTVLGAYTGSVRVELLHTTSAA